MVLNSKLVVWYGFLFLVPTVLTLIYTGGRTQLSREELLQSEAYKEHQRATMRGPEDEQRVAEMKAAMNKVLFETKGSLGKPEWVIKRDEKRAALEAKKREQQEAAGAAGK